MSLVCSYVGCGDAAAGILAINTQGGFTVPMPMCTLHSDYRGKVVHITYVEERDLQFQVEYLPPDIETSLAVVLQQAYESIEMATDPRRGLWRRLWHDEKAKVERNFDLLADILFGLGIPLHNQSPLALPIQLRERLGKLWHQNITAGDSATLEETLMMLDGTVQWIPDESAT